MWLRLVRLALGAVAVGGMGLLSYSKVIGLDWRPWTWIREDRRNSPTLTRSVQQNGSGQVAATDHSSVHQDRHDTVDSSTATTTTNTNTTGPIQHSDSGHMAVQGGVVSTVRDIVNTKDYHYGPIAGDHAQVVYTLTVSKTHALVVVSAVAVTNVVILYAAHSYLAGRSLKYQQDVEKICESLNREAEQEKKEKVCRHNHLSDATDRLALFTPYQSSIIKAWNRLVPSFLSADPPDLVNTQAQLLEMVIGRCQTRQIRGLMAEVGANLSAQHWHTAIYRLINAFYFCAKRYWHLDQLPTKVTAEANYEELNVDVVLVVINGIRAWYQDDRTYQLQQVLLCMQDVASLVAASTVLSPEDRQWLWSDTFGAFVHVHYCFYPELVLNASFVDLCRLWIRTLGADVLYPYVSPPGKAIRTTRDLFINHQPRLCRLLNHRPAAPEGATSPSLTVAQSDPSFWTHYEELLDLFGLPPAGLNDAGEVVPSEAGWAVAQGRNLTRINQ